MVSEITLDHSSCPLRIEANDRPIIPFKDVDYYQFVVGQIGFRVFIAPLTIQVRT